MGIFILSAAINCICREAVESKVFLIFHIEEFVFQLRGAYGFRSLHNQVDYESYFHMSSNNKTIINGLHLSLLVSVNLQELDVVHEQ